MDQQKMNKDIAQPLFVKSISSNAVVHHELHGVPRLVPEVKVPDPLIDMKLKKSLVEKWRRERPSNLFIYLENGFDQGRDNEETLIDNMNGIHLDLTTQVHRLEAENATLVEQVHELKQKKFALEREAKILKSEIKKLKKTQQNNQRRLRDMSLWSPISPMVAPLRTMYSFPVVVPVHPNMQGFPCFGFRNPGLVPDANSVIMPSQAGSSPSVDQICSSYSSSTPGITSSNESTNVTVLKPKTQGSASQQELTGADKKGKRQHVEKHGNSESCGSNRLD